MDDISENTLEITNGNQLSVHELREYIDKHLRYLHSRNEVSINIGLSGHAEISELKNSQKLLEDSKTIPSTFKIISGPQKDKELKEKFHSFVEKWKEETQFASTVLEMAMHPAYQHIIGMGPKVLPYIFQRLSREQEHWFWALKAITSEDPVPPASRGNINRMRDAWLQWGREKGYEW